MLVIPWHSSWHQMEISSLLLLSEYLIYPFFKSLLILLFQILSFLELPYLYRTQVLASAISAYCNSSGYFNLYISHTAHYSLFFALSLSAKIGPTIFCGLFTDPNEICWHNKIKDHIIIGICFFIIFFSIYRNIKIRLVVDIPDIKSNQPVDEEPHSSNLRSNRSYYSDQRKYWLQTRILE